MTEPEPTWPPEFSIEVRAIILARDTPDGRGWPVCVVCGGQAGRVVHVHHRRYKSRQGDGRPSNGIVVCGDGQGEGCHRARIHDHGRDAALAGWAISRHGPAPGCYAQPLRCAWRGPVVLLDAPGEDGRHWRPATPEEAMACAA